MGGALERWLRQVEAGFDGRVLGIDNAVSDQWGRMSAIRPIPIIDDRDIASWRYAVRSFRIDENHRRS
jgi:hypothetical protein